MNIEPVKITKQFLGLLGNRILVSAESLEAMRRQASKGLSVAAPLQLQEGPTGRHLALNRRGGFWAVLDGASSPYGYQEQRLVSGTWEDGSRTGTTAYEVNGVGGLAGKRVWLEPGGPGDYRFQWIASTGDGGGTCPEVKVTVFVTGCNCEIPDATVTLLKDGVTIGFPIVTGLDGKAEWSSLTTPALVQGLDYSVTVSDTPLYIDTSGTLSFVACGNNGLVIDLNPVDGYICGPCCPPGVPQPLLTFNGVSGSTGTLFSIPIPFDGPCLVPTGASTLPIYLTEGSLSFLVTCEEVIATLQTCGYLSYVGIGDPPDREHAWRYVFTLSGSVLYERDCLGAVNISVIFPDDFGIELPYENRSPHFPSHEWILELDDPGLSGTYTFTEESPAPKPTQLPGGITSGQLCITVKTPCSSSNLIEGASVTIVNSDGDTVGSGMTGADGKYCVNVSGLPDTFTVTAQKNGCSVERSFGINSGCLAFETFEREIILCCSEVCVVVKDVVTTDPIAGAVVNIGTRPEVIVTGEDGRACFTYTSSQISQLYGSGCPAVQITARAQGYLTLCKNVNLVCNDTTTDQELLLYALFSVDPVTEEREYDYVYNPDCPDDGCLVSGIYNRGLIATEIHVAMSAEVQDEEGTWYSVLGDLIDGVDLVFTLDDVLFNAEEDPDAAALTDSPFGWTVGDGRIIEYRWEGATDFTPPGCSNAYTTARAWFRQGVGLVVRLYGPGFVSANIFTCPPYSIPFDAPFCPTCGSDVRFQTVEMLFDDFDFCLPFDITKSGGLSGGSGGRDYRFTVEATE